MSITHSDRLMGDTSFNTYDTLFPRKELKTSEFRRVLEVVNQAGVACHSLAQRLVTCHVFQLTAKSWH